MNRERALDAALRQRIGQRVYRLRRERKMTALVLAARSGVHRNTIYRIEAGLSLCLAGQVWRLAQALGVEIGEIFDDSPRMVQCACKTRRKP